MNPKLLFIGLIATAISCSSSNQEQETNMSQDNGKVDSDDFGDLNLFIEQGNEIVANTFSLLSSNLTAAAQEGGLSYALEFCNEKAIPLTASMEEKFKVSIKRTSHRVRNTENNPDEEEQKMINHFLTVLKETGSYPEPQVSKHNDLVRYFAPIILAPQCVKCHGNKEGDIEPDLYQVIKEYYPEDQATEFKPGEIRGMWSLTFTSKED
jgi:predicted HicB family RNase H-like nuclease